MWWFLKGCKSGYKGHFFFLDFCQGPSLKHSILWLYNPTAHRWRCCVFTKASGFSHNVKPSPEVWKNQTKCLFTIWLTVKVHFKSDLHMDHQIWAPLDRNIFVLKIHFPSVWKELKMFFILDCDYPLFVPPGWNPPGSSGWNLVWGSVSLSLILKEICQWLGGNQKFGPKSRSIYLGSPNSGLKMTSRSSWHHFICRSITTVSPNQLITEDYRIVWQMIF